LAAKQRLSNKLKLPFLGNKKVRLSMADLSKILLINRIKKPEYSKSYYIFEIILLLPSWKINLSLLHFLRTI